MSFNISNFKVIDSMCWSRCAYAYDKKGREYECDSCPEVWEKVHKVMHKHSKLTKIFGSFDNKTEENNRRIAIAIENDKYKPARYTIGGDTDFNMEFKTDSEFNKYIKDNNINDKIKHEILDMYKYKYCYENFSLLLTTGGNASLQSLKGCRCEKFGRKDNVCVFISKLYKDFYNKNKSERMQFFKNVDNVKFYKKGDDIEEKNKNARIKAKDIMYKYLDSFNNIEDYCKEIYKIDESLVKSILIFADTEYRDYNEGIKRFIEIIKEMWECKRKFLEENK